VLLCVSACLSFFVLLSPLERTAAAGALLWMPLGRWKEEGSVLFGPLPGSLIDSSARWLAGQ